MDCFGDLSRQVYSVDIYHQSKISSGISMTVIKAVMAIILLPHNLFIGEPLSDSHQSWSVMPIGKCKKLFKKGVA